MKKRSIFFTVIAVLLFFSMAANAETYKVAIMKVPVANAWENLITAIGEATGNTFQIEIVPPGRANMMIENKDADVQAPKIRGKNAAFNKSQKFDFATQTVHQAAFVLYTNKDKPININELRNGNPKGYKIETDGSSLKQFGFSTIFSNNAGQSLKKLSAGRIDGYIISQTTGDPALKALKLKNIRRQLWDNFDGTFAIRKDQAGGKLDDILTDGIKKLQANGKLEQIMGNIIRQSKYNDWQP